VVSGGAFGCDASAHYGVLSSKSSYGKAVVVFAGGLDMLSPKQNISLFKDIYENGGIFVSEKFFNSVVRRSDFPVRNRIISGLVERVYLIQSSLKSGAKLTANIALEQGKDLKVYRRIFGDPISLGNESLIEEGASWFMDLEQVKNGGFTQAF
jgi:DNA processing protein